MGSTAPRHFKQFYVGCLAHASYLIGDAGEAVVVDPSRDVQMYLDEASAHGLKIRWVLETHLHADFVSGHRELAARTGATIAIGSKAGAEYPHHDLNEGDEITVGDVRIRAMETPGHTPESLSFLVFGRAADTAPWAALTGDTLFVGDVGRVDILSSRLSVRDLAGMLYDSLHGKLLKLPDETRVYPAHGAGSLCGRSIRKETWSTLGKEREMNPALTDHGREAFIEEVMRDVPETPVYFLHSRDLNKAGPALDDQREFPPQLSVEECARRVAAGAVLLDARSTVAVAACHPRGALAVSLDGQFASWVGTLVRPDQEIVLIVDAERAEEAVTRLGRVGYERIAGWIDDGCDAWRDAGLPTEHWEEMLAADLKVGDPSVLDVRRDTEWQEFHLAGARHVPLAQLTERLAELKNGQHWAVVCASGYRSAIAASVLERAGFPAPRTVVDGMDAYRHAGLPVASGS